MAAKSGFYIEDRSISDIWSCKWTSARPNGHPAEKPEELVSRTIATSEMPENIIVFDPFIGSGTTAVAALKLNHHFYGCDVNPDYVRLANARIEKTRMEMSQMELSLRT